MVTAHRACAALPDARPPHGSSPLTRLPGVPPPAPAAGAPPAAGAAAEAVAPAKQQGQISVDRTQDLYWQTFPQDFDRVLVSRDQTASGRREYKLSLIHI